MVLTKNLLSLIAIAIAFGSQIHAEAANLKEICDSMKQKIADRKDLKDDGEKLFAFAKNYIKGSTSFFSSERKLIKSWDDIIHGKDCVNDSAESWNNLLLMGVCHQSLGLKSLDQPIEAYSEKCLTPEYATKMVKLQASSSKAKTVPFVDTQFIEKYYQDNPNDKPLHLDWVGRKTRDPELFDKEMDRNCCRPKKSIGAIIDAVERDLSNQGKTRAEVFDKDPQAVTNYLEDKLFEPCRGVKNFYEYLGAQFGVISAYYKGGPSALIASLDQEAKSILFRYKYCQLFVMDEVLLVEKEIRTILIGG